jgi:hypothetical protein
VTIVIFLNKADVMRRVIFAISVFLGLSVQATAATTGSGLYTFTSYPSYSGPIVGSFSFQPSSIEAARSNGESTAVIGYDDLVDFYISDTKTKIRFFLADVVPTFAINVKFNLNPTDNHVSLYGNTSLLAVSGKYRMSFINGLDVLLSGPTGDEIKHGYWSHTTAYVPLPASAFLLAASALFLAAVGWRRRV